MQTGFALLEAGAVSGKSVANIIVKNAVDVSVGGLIYWMVGFGLSFGEPSTAFWYARFVPTLYSSISWLF